MNSLLPIMAASRRRADPDAADYFARIVAAGSAISTANRAAVNAFVVGCKADGIWSAIKASCLLAGPDDLTGALVPLVGTAPTNNGFLTGDYSRTGGLTNNASAKYIDSNRAGNADGQDNCSYWAWVDTYSGGALMGNTVSNASAGQILLNFNNSFRCKSGTLSSPAAGAGNNSLHGMSREISSEFTVRKAGSSTPFMVASDGNQSANIRVGSRINVAYLNGTIKAYGIGESLDLALLDARLATYTSSLT